MNRPSHPPPGSDAAVASAKRASLELVDLREHPDEDLLAAVHDGLYARSFPRPEEREDLDTLRAGLWGEERDVPPVCHFVVARSAAGEIAGFVACEYYPRSRCGLLSYVAVDSQTRGKRIGRALVDRATAALHADAERAGDRLAAVFGEIHDPAKISPEEDVMPPLDRVRIMARFGAMRVPVAYVQPQLGPGRGRGRTLMLVAFPTEGKPVESLPPAVVRAFLGELYQVLGVARPEEDVDFARSLVGLREDVVELVPLVPVERPLMDEVSEYGIGVHLAVAKPRSHGGSDAAVRSFEEDILAYAYRDAPPFRTRAVVVADEWARVAVEFAGDLTFLSEGRRVTFLSEGRRLSLRNADGPAGRTRRFLVRASRTDFETSGVAILHLVFGPDPGSPDSSLNEYDLIKLMKLWQGGEGLTLDGLDASGKRFVRFRAGDRECTLLELAARVFGEEVAADAPRVGTVQILHPICRAGLCDAIVEVREREGAAKPWPEVVAIGGLVQGLLDFAEIDADELADVLKEVDVEEELIRAFHKGTLLVVSASDRAFSAENIRVAIGLSPYLLVPHAILLHNEWLLRDAVQRLDEAGRRGRGKLGRLEAARGEVAKTLSQRLVPNVFHYAEERGLYERGRRSRALHKRQQAVAGRLAAVTGEIGARHERVRSGVARALPVIALVFTWSDALAKHDHTVVFAVLVPITVLTFAALALIFWRD